MSDPIRPDRRSFSRDALMIGGGALLALMAGVVWMMWSRGGGSQTEARLEAPSATREAAPNELRVSSDVLAAAGIEMVGVTARPMVERLQATGVVEPNQLKIQQVTPLVGGRVERVAVALGDHVQTGTLLLTISSPQIAEMRGNLRAAEAKLAEADATLTRTKRLVELGAGAGKDLVAAEAGYETAEAQVAQLRQSLEALGAESADAGPAVSTITIHAPMTGAVLERTVNPGAWIEAGKPLFTIADLGTVWVIVNVPEARLGVAHIGTRVEIRAPASNSPRTGRVSYIDPQLDQTTRTARVRVEVSNPGEQLKVGQFVEVTLQGAMDSRSTEMRVPSDAVQRIGERTVVFVAKGEPGVFEIRDVELGDQTQNLQVVLHGLAAGDRVVTKGAFTLKSQVLKGQFGEDETL